VRRAAWGVALAGAGIVATIAGLARPQGTELAFSAPGVVEAIGRQLRGTLVSNVAVLVAVLANVIVGGLVLRMVTRRPFASMSDLVLQGAGAAVLLDTTALTLLGSVGLFRAEIVLVLHVIVAVAARRWATPLFDSRDRPQTIRSEPGPIVWVLVAFVWASPVLLSIVSPVVPFPDVLPNHVAPVEHVRTFGSFTDLATVPSPIYGPSRSFLGYIGTVSTASVTTGVAATRAVAAMIVPVTALMVAAAVRFARRFDASAGPFAVLAVPLTVAFVRLPDVRSSVVALPLAITALALAADRSTRERTTPLAVLGAATVLVHPIIGGLTIVIVGTIGLTEADRSKGAELLRAAAASFIFAVPQAIAMAGIRAPAWTFALALPLAIIVGRSLPGIGAIRWTKTMPFVLAVVAIAILPALPTFVRGMRETIVDVARFPLLLAGTVATIVAAHRRLRTPALLVVGVPALIASIVRVMPGHSVAWQSLRFEVVAKIGEFWVPMMLAVFTAVGLSILWRSRRASFAGRLFVIAAVVAAAYPFGSPQLRSAPIEEVRYAQSLAIAFHHAEFGPWDGYAHPYLLIDHTRRQLVDAINDEISRGRLRADDGVLHIAESFQQWSATPLAVFTGVMETMMSPDPERSGHTLGGRLHHIGELDALLERRFAYVVVEGHVDTDVVPALEDEGYDVVFTNADSTLYRR
jgi:hypothetical protein